MALRKMEVGKTYVLFDSDSSAHFRGLVVKRTACTVTFALSDVGRGWCERERVTLRVKKSGNLCNCDGNRLEELSGTATSERNELRRCRLYTTSDHEAHFALTA